MKKYHIVVFGCQMNISDAERVSAVLESKNYKQAGSMEDADLICVVMCSIRQSAVDRVHWLVEKFKALKKTNPKLKTILTGCILKKDKRLFARLDQSGQVAGFDQVLDIKEIINFDIAPKYQSKSSALVPIMTGCNNFCSYCVVPYTREREISRPAKEIITEIKNLIKNGYKEIWLLGQNVNSYRDGKINFPELLKMANDIPGNFKLNFTSSHPKDFSDELIKTMAECQKLSMDLNLPLQSGDNAILKKMNRPYTVEQYKNLVKKIRKTLPNIRLSTDIIVGFPGETKKQFNNTVKTIKEIGYGVAFINKYSPREGTAAAKLKDDVPWAEKKRREKILIDLINAKPACPQAGKLLVILGPTASGKTDLAIKLAKKYNGEIVSADSRQIYRGMDIGTAKPLDLEGIPHYLLDIKNPNQPYAVAEYKEDAIEAIKNIQKRGKLPILAGGTGLYIKSIVENLDIPKIKANPALRQKIENEIKKRGLDFVFKKLVKLDPEATYIVDPKNPRRVVRALKITLLTKKPFSAQRKSGKPLFDVLELGILLPKEELNNRINLRAGQMIENGLVSEVKSLIGKYGQNQQAFDAIGYREIIECLNNKINLKEATENIKTNTRHFAKRQTTWFKKDKKIIWISNFKEAVSNIDKFVNN